MKRLLLTNFLSVWVVPLALATTDYINNGSVAFNTPPQIDALNFINNGTFSVFSTLPFQTWNTRNWTNNNQMTGIPGFQFNCFNSARRINGWSANFQNSANANIYGSTKLLVSATNIINKGTMTISGSGLMTVDGKNLDLSRGTLAATAQLGLQDLYWGIDAGTNILTASFKPTGVSSSYLIVTNIQGLFYGQFAQNLSLSSFDTYAKTTTIGTNLAYDVLFLRQTNPAITTTVRFGANYAPGYEKIVQWQALLTNLLTGVVTTNRLYLDDTFADWSQPPSVVTNRTLGGASTFRPTNYRITSVAPSGYANGITNLLRTFPDLTGTNDPVFVTNAGYAATLTASANTPNATIAGSTYTNVPGRIQITATGPKSYLNLTRANISGESYLLLSATNHFVGAANAAIISPISDIYLGSTNGTMVISNLITPAVPGMVGEIQVWSGRWTNATKTGAGAIYNVTMVDSALETQAPSQIQNLSLRSTNLVISDALNVFGSLLLDTLNLTISANAGNALTPYGELNLTLDTLVWSAGLPKLQNLTNFGIISTPNSIYFGGARTPPWFSGRFDEPYQSFVTHNLITSDGCAIWAKYLEASGTIDSGAGPLSVQAGSAIVTNGYFLAPSADITFTCGSLLISNQFLWAGNSINLTVTNYLDDGSLSNKVAGLTQNFWTVGNGINLWRPPTNASLLATTVFSTASPNTVVDNYWAGKDYGCLAGGFVNNAALGHLILDGQDDGSLFEFFRTGLTNALYVDLLEFQDAATNFVTNALSGNFLAALEVNLETNFTIYYGDAIVANGATNSRSIAEKLNGAYGVDIYGTINTSGGRFRWVSNYNTGFFSSTSVVYTNGSVHQLNRALVQSCDIDSNGNGLMNCSDPNPVPVLTPSTLVLKATLTNSPSRAAVLSWNTLPLASNYLYASSSLLAPSTNWLLVTQFFSDATIGGRVTVKDPIGTNGVRFYRAKVLSP